MRPYPKKLCPYKPHPKQDAFLGLTCQEAFFGGAAGGGKSAALLMAALQYVDVPGYSALILRKDTQRLALSGGLIPRSHEWLAGKARWNEARRRWAFPRKKGPPATLTFGYLANQNDKYRYASSEFQYIAFDELTELREEDYLFLFSRLRRTKNLNVPLRIRSASNPGNIGHEWVKARFVRDWSPGGPLPEGMIEENGVLYMDDLNKAFLPSLIADNKSLDADEYRQSLMHLLPLDRERLMNGDWNVREEGIFLESWFRYYHLKDEQYDLLGVNSALVASIRQQDCRTFATVDPAGTSEEADNVDGKSWTVVQTWHQPRHSELSRFLILKDQLSKQIHLQGVAKLILGAYATWKHDEIWIEDESRGHGLRTALLNESPQMPVRLIRTEGRKKEERAVPLANKLERGEVFLPSTKYDWRMGFERELLAWTGKRGQTCDQIDAAAYAAIIAERNRPGIITMQPIVVRM